MANIGWGHVMAAAVGGYLNGQQIGQRQLDAEEEKKAKAEDRDYILAQRQRTTKQQGIEDQLQTNLQDAARPVVVAEGAGGMVRPATMDNRDVGLPENAALPNGGLLPAGYRVADQAFTDRPQAEAAAAKQNAPEAVNSRIIAAYRGAGQVDKAMQVEGNMCTAEVQKMQLADAKWRRDLSVAMQSGLQGLAELATNSEAGPMAGMKVQLIPGVDGKVTFGALDADGKVQPIPGLPSFTNDQNGITQAAFMLDKNITPEARLAHFAQQQDRDSRQKNGDRDYKLKEREVDSKIEANWLKAENMMLRTNIMASRGTGGGGGSGRSGGGSGQESASFDPLSDFDPKQARKAAMDQAIEEAKSNPGKDGAPVSEKQISSRAQAIYGGLRDAAATDNSSRQRAVVFSKAARVAKTPEEIEAVRTRALQSGYTPQEMASLDPRFAPKQPPPAAAAKGAAQPMALSAPAPAPMDAAGVKVDKARAQLAALRSRPAPGMAAGRTAIDNYAAQVEAARQAVAQAEAEYQRTVSLSGAAFRSPSM